MQLINELVDRMKFGTITIHFHQGKITQVQRMNSFVFTNKEEIVDEQNNAGDALHDSNGGDTAN